MPADLVRLDLARFSARDLEKIGKLAGKLRLMHRWYRSERVSTAGADEVRVYSGDRSNAPYSCYRISRHADGTYRLPTTGPDAKSPWRARSIRSSKPSRAISSTPAPGAKADSTQEGEERPWHGKRSTSRAFRRR